MKPKRFALTRLAMALLPLAHAGHAQTATATWIGPDEGLWSLAANWSGNALPTAVDDALLGSFNTQIIGNVAGNSSRGGLTMVGGTFTSDANTEISGALNWVTGSFRGPGTTRVRGSATIDKASGGVLGVGHTLVLSGSNRTLSDDAFNSFYAPGIGSFDNTGSTNVNAGPLAGSGTVRSLNTFTNTGILGPGGVGQIGQLQVPGNLATSGNLQVDLGRSGSEFATLNFSQASGYRFATRYNADGLSVAGTGLPFTWTGANNGLWDVVSNWNNGSDGVPQTGDTALLGSFDTRIRSFAAVAAITGTGTLKLEGGSAQLHLSDSGSVGGLVLSEGQLVNDGSLLATGPSTWVSTILRGAGTTRLQGAVAIAHTGHNSMPTLRDGHTLVLAGTSTFTGTRGLLIDGGARLVNQGTFLDEALGDVSLTGGGGRLDNQGTYSKNLGFVTNVGGGADMRFSNSGTINVNAGHLLFSSPAGSTGHIRIASGAELSLSSSSFSLGGTVVNGGTLNLGGTVNLAGDLTVQGDGLTRIRGSVNNSGVFRINGSVDWRESSLRGSGSTRLDGPVMVSGDRSRGVYDGQTVELAATTRQVGTGGFDIGEGSRLRNLGTWLDEAPGNVTFSNGGRFDNEGSFTKASASVTNFAGALRFSNTGTMNVSAGTLLFTSPGSNTGQFNIASGAELILISNSFSLGGSVVNAGTLGLDGGHVNLASNVTVQGDGLTRLKATVNNNSVFRINGSVDWNDSLLRGSGSIRMDGPVMVTGDRTRGVLGGQTVEVAGATTQVGTGSFSIGEGSRLRNLGTWLDAAAGHLSIGNFNGGADSRFDNEGTFTKTSAFVTGVGAGSMAFNNTGTVNVNAGTLLINVGFNNQGRLNVAAGAELHGNVGNFANAGILAGDGTVRAQGSLTNTGTLAAGGLNDAGTLSLLGSLAQQAGGIFLVDLGGTAAGSFDLFSVSGSALLGGTLAVNLLDGAQFNVGDSFTVMSWGQRLNDSQFASLDLTHAGGYSFATEYAAHGLTLRVMTAPVPEPGSWALMAAGLLGMGCWRWRRAAEGHRAA